MPSGKSSSTEERAGNKINCLPAAEVSTPVSPVPNTVLRLGAGHGGRMFVLLCTRASCSKVSALCSAAELGAIVVAPCIKSSLMSCSTWQAPGSKAHTVLQTHIPSQFSARLSNFAPKQKNPLCYGSPPELNEHGIWLLIIIKIRVSDICICFQIWKVFAKCVYLHLWKREKKIL